MAANPPTPRTSSSAKPKSSDFVVKHAPEIKDRIVLVTGVSPGGLGAIFVERLSTCPTPPRRIILAGRSPAKFEEIKAKVEQNGIEAKVLALDLASFKSVRQAAEVVNGWDEGVDVLVNNAGIMAVPFTKTEDGYESQLQANHMGHFLFTGLIMDQLLKRENGRVVNVSSERAGEMRQPTERGS
jgi:NAD(P)-dependent dehydrogenase (short-subunit alcohol dehydrogenase family)